MRSLIGMATGIAVAYLSTAFVTLEPDFRLWSMDGRFNTCLMALLFGFIGALSGVPKDE